MPGSQVGRNSTTSGSNSALSLACRKVPVRQFHKDFGDTAALMLTVASPKISETAIALRC